ncbi:hypothetical protein [Solimicrobium silvestre]|uniref:Uncharacterized protein n=1 Tax=Solimicrobium silvestre TaxID=2099400 RepID=A0A2S9GT42_9BURK|nr:hypothetical protein [Solimicrobium silvestre]PRC90858.1 hypothetical protein S2091_4439 [Solimicrobium silvestre]
MHLRVLTFVSAMFIAYVLSDVAIAEEIVSRYGKISAVELPNKSGSYSIGLDDKSITTVDALAVSLYRVTPSKNEKVENIIVEKVLPGLNCHNEYLLVTISQDRKSIFSPSFGKCMELDGVENLNERVTIRLHSTEINTNNKLRIDSYVWANGKLNKI